MILSRSRERFAWCDDPSCRWTLTHVTPVNGGEDPVLAEAHLHHAATGHPVTVQKVTTIRYLPDNDKDE